MQIAKGDHVLDALHRCYMHCFKTNSRQKWAFLHYSNYLLGWFYFWKRVWWCMFTYSTLIVNNLYLTWIWTLNAGTNGHIKLTTFFCIQPNKVTLLIKYNIDISVKNLTKQKLIEKIWIWFMIYFLNRLRTYLSTLYLSCSNGWLERVYVSSKSVRTMFKPIKHVAILVEG